MLPDDVVTKLLLVYQENINVPRKLVQEADQRFGTLSEMLDVGYVYLRTGVERHSRVRVKLLGVHSIAVILVVCTNNFARSCLTNIYRMLAMQSGQRIQAFDRVFRIADYIEGGNLLRGL